MNIDNLIKGLKLRTTTGHFLNAEFEGLTVLQKFKERWFISGTFQKRCLVRGAFVELFRLQGKITLLFNMFYGAAVVTSAARITHTLHHCQLSVFF